jgi:uncharacterized protein (DUF2225 family)
VAPQKKISFRASEKLVCPVCDMEFNREEILSGGGRMNAGKLTQELHRVYLPTEKYGDIYPLIYPVTVCPKCYNAAFPKDFLKPPAQTLAKLKEETHRRKQELRELEVDVNFTENRGLQEGIASYFLALLCYEHYPKEFSPCFRQALCSLRGAWLCDDLHVKKPQENWDYLRNIFYRKAAFLYAQVVEQDQKGKEVVSQLQQFGPDIDKNYSFDGVLYLSGLLEYEYGQKNDPQTRGIILKRARSTISRIVGMGKSSKSKPGVLLDHSRDLHKEIKKALQELGLDA